MRLLPLALVLAGCAAAASSTNDDEVRSVERAMIGRAVPYAADTSLAARDSDLARSKKLRRQVAWNAIAKVLKDTPLQETQVQAPVPAWRTWYQKDDFQRMFARAYAAHGADNRKARAPFARAAVDDAFAWNATDRGAWTEQQYFDRVRQAASDPQVQGIGGNARVQYSSGLVRHFLNEYSAMTKCRGTVNVAPDAMLSPTNFTSCFGEEAPADAALIKAVWSRADFGMKLPVRPTNAEALTARLAGTRNAGGWGDGVTQATPDAASIYTVKMTDGSSFRMPGMHLVTKELRHWLWISIWWSPEPDTDFGADRPASLTGVWKNYKMCVVSDYLEQDDDPTGGMPGTLGAALAAVHTPGGPTWCSNQYIERGDKNAETNCIGCHQHAGTDLQTVDVLGDETKFPKSGREQIRKNFISDYMYATTSAPEAIVDVIGEHVDHFDSIDR